MNTNERNAFPMNAKQNERESVNRTLLSNRRNTHGTNAIHSEKSTLSLSSSLFAAKHTEDALLQLGLLGIRRAAYITTGSCRSDDGKSLFGALFALLGSADVPDVCFKGVLSAAYPDFFEIAYSVFGLWVACWLRC
jgi:hypothetical protein